MREEYLSRYGALTSEGQSGVYLPGGADSDSAEANDPMEAEAPSRAYLLALHGHESAPSAPVVDKSGATVGLYSEPGGCVAAATERLYGSTERYRTMFSTPRNADQYVADAFAATMVMASSSPLTSAWSDCLYQSTGSVGEIPGQDTSSTGRPCRHPLNRTCSRTTSRASGVPDLRRRCSEPTTTVKKKLSPRTLRCWEI